MVRGKGHGPKFDVEQCAFSPRFTHLVTFTPRIARIRPAVYAQAVRNDASITCWYQRQASPEAGHWRNTDPWTASLFSVWVVLAHHYSIFSGNSPRRPPMASIIAQSHSTNAQSSLCTRILWSWLRPIQTSLQNRTLQKDREDFTSR